MAAFSLALVAAGVIGLQALAQQGAAQNNPQATVTVADLQKAGYTNPRVAAPTAAGRFHAPPYYFQVDDKVTAPTSEAPDIVMVSFYKSSYSLSKFSIGDFYTYGSDSRLFAVAGGQGKEGTLFDGRLAINFTKGSYYVVVMGPNKQKIEALAAEVAANLP